MMSDSVVTGNGAEPERLLRQRDLALSCAILAVVLTVAMLWSNFGVEPTEIRQAQQAVQQHRTLLAEHQKIMDSVQAAVLANQRELEKMKQSR